MTRAADNKGGRDDMDHLPADTLDLFKGVVGFGPLVFGWPHDRRMLVISFHRIQAAAKINLPCPDAGKQKECAPACHLYVFHALHRAKPR
jgi:hypothetical protein